MHTIDHIGIAVADLPGALKLYADTLRWVELARERNEHSGVELVFLGSAEGTTIELLAPLHEQSQISRFLADRGPGLHHICYRVPNISTELQRLKKLGARLIDEAPRPGARNTLIAFLHPQSFGGVLTELCQYTAE